MNSKLAPVMGSAIAHAVLLAILALRYGAHALPGAIAGTGHADPIVDVELIDLAPPPAPTPATPAHAGGGGSPGHGTGRIVAAAHRAWDDVAVSTEARDDGGDGGAGGGIGGGHGTGIGLGDGGGIGAPPAIPPAPAPPRPAPSLARAARLLYPSRQTQVDDDELFHAIVTVDDDGDVVGAHLTRTLPGVRGDTAASMIWQFRYDPARDAAGNRVRSTFEQVFAVR